ncbi:MAG: PIN domain-containing protein [Thermoanaerobaculia bacterium]
MIAADTSSCVAYFQGEAGADVELLDDALRQSQLHLPAPVLTELLSNPRLPAAMVEDLLALPLLEPSPGFWARAGSLRCALLAKHHKARLGDALIAQLCIDHSARLISRDRDFRTFAEAAKLDLLA